MKVSTISTVYRRKYHFTRKELEELARKRMSEGSVYPVPAGREGVTCEWNDDWDLDMLVVTVETPEGETKSE